ncbi:MAG: hypothetical protein A2750_00155 [Candidatus Yanofskybacteria bacterium RIFCSPHIGHO2_01_FULL_45_42]|uniref:Putative 3-methyladenine DNA glycosylase n=3 Tax=Candidatus Yanofskyibacteriota TaxID=1752733 RepID=A0A1F8F3Y0_9BACT|nr:MAG: hypothetical protein A2750_00155 [Candidatus Yanofskybacteria bacterium RIFCSPHIGHO2_01_FULL_45_42]OGN15862.1 MAG: hypothetical protein A3C81_02090 [Candidatus Yanofskybacteria bacterium RIFCSPHIGHO2_02_FULL_46_19]OGN27439.1 MAG: hypothetical protein A3B17_01545 [Candidatus Yanofskybacteria bacterium RIFCSPLOWO2_01_FULL_45_72]OGN32300.1 MAG: hypothetical protein A3J01_02455 [Candidatus Yanofskybacteria bacterium RIFCSPLOWO2_02_FULL_45_18]
MRLTKKFFNRNTAIVAKDLLGKFLVRKIGRKIVFAMITETEAYHGPHDRASHASRGLTPRTKIMFGPPGYIYVYMIYGIYHCLNFVTGRKRFPAAVLIRSVILTSNNLAPSAHLNGPGKLCRVLRIDRRLNGLPIGNSRLWIEARGIKVPRRVIKYGKRIGVDYAGKWKDRLWRFYIKTERNRRF